ncbi:MAG: glycosyltransferase family 9 protein [Candidatus Methylomirabilia bacterium]
MILIIHPGALGDVLQAVPALVALRSAGGGNHLTFAGQWRIGQFLSGAGMVEAALGFESLGLETLFAPGEVPNALGSRLAGFDRVISWFGARAWPFPDRLRGVVSDTLIALPVSEPSLRSTVWEHLVESLRPWAVTAPPMRKPLALPESWRAEAHLVLIRLGCEWREPLLAVHPGAGGGWKRWPAEHMAEALRRVARDTGCQVLLHQGPADGDATAALLARLDLPVIHLVEPPLYLLAAILAVASAYLGNDSGVSHLAASVGTASVILFPPKTRELWAPWSPSAEPVVVQGQPDEVEIVARAVTQRLAASRSERRALALPVNVGEC